MPPTVSRLTFGPQRLAQPRDDIAHPLAAGTRFVGRVGQLLPHCPHRSERPHVRLRLGQRRPHHAQIRRAQLRIGRDALQRHFRFGTMAILVGGEEVIGIVHAMPCVEIDDALDAILVAIGLRRHRIRREHEAVRLEHDVLRDVPRRREVLLQEGRRHGERFARVVEAGLVRRIDGKLPRRPNIDSGEIANRVVELRIAQPPRQHGPRIAGMTPRFAIAQRANPRDDRAALGRLGLVRRLFRRHLLRHEPFEHRFPLRDAAPGEVAAQIERRLRFLAAVARNAIAVDERLHLCCEALIERIGSRPRLLRFRRRTVWQPQPRAEREEPKGQDRDSRALAGH